MSDAHSIPHLLLVLAALLAAAKLLGALAQRLGQPAVLGELIAGVLLGKSVLGLLDPADPVIAALSELGVIVLLFEIGLDTDLRRMMKVAGAGLYHRFAWVQGRVPAKGDLVRGQSSRHGGLDGASSSVARDFPGCARQRYFADRHLG